MFANGTYVTVINPIEAYAIPDGHVFKVSRYTHGQYMLQARMAGAKDGEFLDGGEFELLVSSDNLKEFPIPYVFRAVITHDTDDDGSYEPYEGRIVSASEVPGLVSVHIAELDIVRNYKPELLGYPSAARISALDDDYGYSETVVADTYVDEYNSYA